MSKASFTCPHKLPKKQDPCVPSTFTRLQQLPHAPRQCVYPMGMQVPPIVMMGLMFDQHMLGPHNFCCNDPPSATHLLIHFPPPQMPYIFASNILQRKSSLLPCTHIFLCILLSAGLVSTDPWAAAKEDEIIAFQQVRPELYVYRTDLKSTRINIIYGNGSAR